MIGKLFRGKKPSAVLLLGLIFVFALSGAAYFTGFKYGLSQTKNIVIKGLANAQNPEDTKADFSVFWQAWDRLKEKHIDGREANEQKFIEGAIGGLADSFDDPYTVYFNAEDSKKFNDDIRGNFGGIGIEIGIRNNSLTVIAPLKGSPAERIGLRSKDNIVEIGNKPTSNLSIEQAVKLIRGDVGTEITLAIYREGWDKTKDFTITRETIMVPTIDWDINNNKIMHLRLYSFNENAEYLFGQAVSEALDKGARGMVLDLRNDPGGYLDTAVNLAGWFLSRGEVVVSEEFSTGLKNIFRANGNMRLKDFPVVVLINEGSASASEILAGALRDNRGVKLVGAKSFGKGTVQELSPLNDGSTLKVTIAKWLLPKGDAIDKNGLEPDYKVELPADWTKDKPDPQLNKAMEVIETQIKK